MDNLIKLLLVCSVIVLPALAVTARFALRPMVEAILRLKEGGILSSAGDPSLRAEVRELRQEVAELQRSIALLQEGDEFHRALRDPLAAGAGAVEIPRLPPTVRDGA